MAPWRVSVGVLTAVVALGSTSSLLLAQEPSPLVTRDEAMRTLKAYERVNERNNSGLGVEGQSTVEAPPIQLIDDATFRELRNRGATLGPQGTVSERSVFVPLQQAHPVQFLSSQLVDFGDGVTSRQLLVFDRTAPDHEWKVTTAALLDHPFQPQLLVDQSGWAARLEADDVPTLKVAPDALAPALAELWTQSEQDGDVTSDLFERGPHTTGAIERRVAELGSTGIEAEVTFAFAATPYPVVSYRLTRGRALTFFVVADTETITPTGGERRLVQPASRTTFGGLVVPGRHRSVRYDRLVLLAAVVPRAGSSERVRVIGSYAGVISASVDAPTDSPTQHVAVSHHYGG